MDIQNTHNRIIQQLNQYWTNKFDDFNEESTIALEDIQKNHLEEQQTEFD